MPRNVEADTSGALDPAIVRRHFERAATRFDSAAALPREIGERLLGRLDLIRLQPERALDLGAGTGVVAEALLRRYRGAQVYAVDSAACMLALARRRGAWWRRPRVVCADAERLPLAAASVNMVVSNLMLPWCLPPDAALAEIRRVLAPGGVLLFSTLGPDTLVELRRSWARVDALPHVNPFMDMHDVGDALLRAEFPEIKGSYVTINSGTAKGDNNAAIIALLVPKDQRKLTPQDLTGPVRQALKAIPGAKFTVGASNGIGPVAPTFQ
ncbi:MAG: methyltransferase domain-containing protein, partial [Acidihalobacter sp.]